MMHIASTTMMLDQELGMLPGFLKTLACVAQER